LNSGEEEMAQSSVPANVENLAASTKVSPVEVLIFLSGQHLISSLATVHGG
jgi:hypothetical protein